MVERPVAAAQDPARWRSRAGHRRGPGRPRSRRPEPLGQARSDRRGEGAAGAMGMAGREPRALPDPSACSRSRARPRPSRPERCPPLTSTARQPSASRLSPAARISAMLPIVAPHRISASGKFGVRMSARAISSRFKPSSASGSISRAPPLATMTGSTTSGMPAARSLQHGGDRLDHRQIVQHAGLDRIGADIVEHDLDLPANEIGRDRQNAEYALGVLRGQRGDRGRRIGVEHRHGLDVGLDAGAAAGIGAGDDQHPAAHCYSAAWAEASRSDAGARSPRCRQRRQDCLRRSRRRPRRRVPRPRLRP